MSELGKISSYRMQKLVGLVFVGCLIVLFLSGFDMIKSKARDVKRRADIKILTEALNLYHDKFGRYPAANNDWQGWDLSVKYGANSDFLTQLKKAGLIDREVSDPVNDLTYHYRYQKYQAGAYGCPTAFYILQAVNFELLTEDNGRGKCPGMDWLEFSPSGYTVQAFD